MSETKIYCSSCSAIVSDSTDPEDVLFRDDWGNDLFKFISDCYCSFCRHCFIRLPLSFNCPACNGNIQKLKERSALLVELWDLRERQLLDNTGLYFKAAIQFIEALLEENCSSKK